MRKQRLHDIADPVHGPTVVVVTGVAQVGRTRVLAELHAAHRARGTRVIATRCDPRGLLLAAPMLASGAVSAADLPPLRGGALGRVSHAHGDPDAAERAAAVLARDLTEGAPTLLLIDDAQWLDKDTRAVLTALIPKIERTAVQLVCAVRTPAPELDGLDGLTGQWHALRARGAAISTRLRPWNRDEIAGALRDVFHAVPASDLIGDVLRLTRGVPGAVTDVIDGLRGSDDIVVVDRHAYRKTGSEPYVLDSGLVDLLSGMGPSVRAVAEAATILGPLGPSMPAVLRESLPGMDTDAALNALVVAGILHRGRSGQSWRFQLPVLRLAIRTRIAPFRRRALAAAAVTAVWAGTTGLDPAAPEVTHWIADACGLLDPGRSRRQLREQAQAAMGTDPLLAARWWAAVAELAVDRRERAEASAMRVIASYAGGDHDQAVRQARSVLRGLSDAVPSNRLTAMLQCFVVALHNRGDTDTLEDIASGGAELIPDQRLALLPQVTATCMLDRWDAAGALLADPLWRGLGTGGRAAALHTDLVETISGLFHGDVSRLAARVSHPPPRGERRYQARWQNDQTVSMLLAIGDYRSAERFLERTGTPLAHLNSFSQAHVAMLRGQDTSGIDAARFAVARAGGHGFDVWYAATVQTLAFMLIGQGRFSGARELLDAARTMPRPASHLVDTVRALASLLLDEPDQAESGLTTALFRTRGERIALGTDVLLLLAALSRKRSDPEAARRLRDELAALASAMTTSRAALCAALAQALVDNDAAAAATCLKISADRAVPFEHAAVTLLLVRARLADPALLTAAYHAFGRLDALLFRAWTRAAMAGFGITVPGRRQALAENERLLAQLVAEGLSNKQIAGLLSTSVKSVEGRLTRLFTRGGYTSRAQLAAAVSDGISPVRAT